MQFLLACSPVLDAVLVTLDETFIDWLIDRHHDLLHCAVVPQLAAFVPEQMLVQGVVYKEGSALISALEMVDSVPGELVPLENLTVVIDLPSGSWGFEASYQGKALEIERPSFTSLELLKVILHHS